MLAPNVSSPRSATDDPDGWPRYAVWAAVVGAVTLLLLAGFAGSLWWLAEQRIDRRPVDALSGERRAEAAEGFGELNVLIVGSDRREGLSEEQQRELRLGEFDGEQADTILLVQLRPGDEEATVVSIPRDLRIEVAEGSGMRVNATLALGGPDLVVVAVEGLTGVAIDHYVEVSIPGFLASVEALGSVEICLEEPLRDRKSGADFDAGCHRMGPEEALAYVRSRAGPRGDFARIERQHRFMAAVLDELTSARVLTNPARVVRLVDHLGAQVTTDEALGLREMRRLAQELRGTADGTVEKLTVPAFADTRDDIAFVSAYAPGAEALFHDLREGRVPPSRGEPEEREEVALGIWTAGLPRAADRVESTLFFGGFEPRIVGRGPVDQAHRTVVHGVDDADEVAEWVASVLGAEVRPLPEDVDVPAGLDVIVVVGRDAERDLSALELGLSP